MQSVQRPELTSDPVPAGLPIWDDADDGMAPHRVGMAGFPEALEQMLSVLPGWERLRRQRLHDPGPVATPFRYR